ncbi:MAG TPA: phosphoribosylanthranilate isomerase [Solirubrobacteraceae bacterium]|nr:phosphoribosylanthranilate isomerase [Solirubrobacteraceae bacterium]
MSPPPLIKICGITRLEDAERSAELGAWALGMIFYPGSPRRCPPAEAERIAAALRRRVELCGVFVNASLDEVARLSERIGLTMLQLHGDEGPAFCREASRRTGARVIKAAAVSAQGELRALKRFHTDFHLLDSRVRGLRGGTGETFDWSLVAHRRSAIPLIVSGGLTPENVAEAVVRTRPFAVDTASGTEQSPGRKDPDKLERFFGAVAGTGKRADAGSGDGADDTTGDGTDDTTADRADAESPTQAHAGS